ncbi:MAG: N-6 DNA methylase [Candidatus Micrarchaeia archaeon]|jgi:type I restriction enzyme M protein
MANEVSEMDVIFKIIAPLLEKLGYNEKTAFEIEHEKTIQIGRGKVVYPDIVVNINGTPAIVIDAKNPTENLDLYERQIISYGLLLKTPYSVLCNGSIFRVYETLTEKIIWEKSLNSTPEFLSKENLTKKIKKTVETISDARLEEAKKTLLVFEGIKEFAAILYKCEDVIRDVDGLTGADAFDEISKLLFAKMYFEKLAIDGESNRFSLSNIKQNGGAKYVRDYLFPEARKNNRDIFIGDEKIALENTSIDKVVELLADYTLVKTDVDVKGRAFEIFLGKTFTGGLGQFFTPRTIVKFAVSFADPEIKSTLSDKHNEPYMVLDPCCGSGGFLTEVFKTIQEKIKHQPDAQRKDLFAKLSHEQIYGVDINERLVRVAKMNMVLHGDGHGGIYKHNGLEDVKEIKKESFDLVITNPPFGNKDKDKRLLEKFELGKSEDGVLLKEQLREILFVERCIELLKKGGELAILLPDGILNNERGGNVRDFIGKETIIKAVVSLPDGSFKSSGANSKTSLLFLKRKSKSDEIQQPIFMGVAEYIGYNTRTKEGKEIEQNDLPAILEAYRQYKSSKMPENLKNKRNVLEILAGKPACFIISPDNMGNRIDATYYYAKHIFNLGVSSTRVNSVACLSRVLVNPAKEPNKIIRYIQFSNIESNLGDVSSHSELLGNDASPRARQLVNAGDVICAKVKDSEENVAIIPDDLEGAIVSTGFVVLKPIPPYTSEALFAILRLKTTTNQVRWKSSGTILPAISENEFMTIKVPKLNDVDIRDITKKIKEVNEQRAIIKEKLEAVSAKFK